MTKSKPIKSSIKNLKTWNTKKDFTKRIYIESNQAMFILTIPREILLDLHQLTNGGKTYHSLLVLNKYLLIMNL